MTRTGYSARLSAHLGEPYLEIHPHDVLLTSKPQKRFLNDIDCWAMAPVKGGWQIEVASNLTPPEQDALMAVRLTRSLQPAAIETLSFMDPTSEVRRRAVFEDSQHRCDQTLKRKCTTSPSRMM